MRAEPPLVIVLVALALAAAPVVSASPSLQCEAAQALVGPDGSVNVTMILSITSPVEGENVTLPVPGSPVYVEAHDQQGIPVPAVPGNGSVTLTIPSNNTTKIILRYVALDLTSKQGPIWRLTLSTGCPLSLVLPAGAVPSSIEPKPQIRVENGTVVFYFPGGSASLEYYLAPEAGAGGGGQGQAGAPPAGQGQTSEAGSAGTAGQGGGGARWALPALAIAALAVAGAGAYLYFSRRGARPGAAGPDIQVSMEGLDERDRAILDALRGSPRGKTASEIMEETGIPRTPLYRRLNKLQRMGLVEYVDEGGVRRYRLRGGGSTL